jgi:hypothetical protein
MWDRECDNPLNYWHTMLPLNQLHKDILPHCVVNTGGDKIAQVRDVRNKRPLLAGLQAKLVLIYGIDKVVLFVQYFKLALFYNALKTLYGNLGFLYLA